jgi:S1-C subfamily serine protease
MPSEELPDDDPSPSGPPLPPEDRLWRHPSELGAYGSDAPEAFAAGSTSSPRSQLAGPARAGGRSRGTLAAVALASCLVGAVLALAGVALLRSEDDPETADTATVATSRSSVSLRTATTLGSAGELAPSVARIVVRLGDRWVSGAGTLVDDRGSVVTAASLVAGASQLTVTFEDGKLRKAEMVGTDDSSGLAVIHVDADGLEPVRMAATPPTVGEQVTLVAGPAEDGHAARTLVGHVRTVDSPGRTTAGTVDDVVEIDREVLPDHDGSGVADTQGRLVGVSLTGDPNDGRGDVVPADVVAHVTDELVAAGAEPRAWLGIVAVDLDDAQATALGVDGGARLTKVEAGSPAGRAGLASGDVVVEIDRSTIASASDVVDALATLQPEQQITIRVLRDGTPVTKTATLGSQTED